MAFPRPYRARAAWVGYPGAALRLPLANFRRPFQGQAEAQEELCLTPGPQPTLSTADGRRWETEGFGLWAPGFGQSQKGIINREIRNTRKSQFLTEERGNALRQGGRGRDAQISARSPEPRP